MLEIGGEYIPIVGGFDGKEPVKYEGYYTDWEGPDAHVFSRRERLFVVLDMEIDSVVKPIQPKLL